MAGTPFTNGIDLKNNKIINVADPTGATDGANKQYVDALVNGLSWKDEVRVATTTNGTLATAYASGSTVDGVTLATTNRILLKNQTTQTENGIYTVNASGAPTRALDADSTVELNNATVFVIDGTVNTGLAFTQTTKAPTVGSSNIVFAQFGAGSSITAGNGLTGTTTFSVLANGTSIDVSSSGVKIADAAGGAGLTVASGILAVGAGTGITVAADTVLIDTAVTARHFAAAIGDNSSTTLTVTHNLGTRDVVVSVYDATGFGEIIGDVNHATTNTVTVTFGTAPTTSQYRAVVVG